MGFFNPQNADQAAIAIELMDFEGKEKTRARIEKNGQLLKVLQEKEIQIQQMATLIMQLKGGLQNVENNIPQGSGETPVDFRGAR